LKAFVICRDRVTYARRCIEAMWLAGLDVVAVDHGSTYQPMLDWLCAHDVESSAAFEVSWWPNRHPRDLWTPGGVIECRVSAGERFIVTDCDVVPDEGCPGDWVKQLGALLDRLPSARKAGLGLRTDDLPDRFEHAGTVREWERKYQAVEDGGLADFTPADGRAVVADIDTTLAMYRWFEPFTTGTALRMRPPYVARHLPWYEDSANPTVEQAYYAAHAQYGHWRAPEGFTDDHNLGG